jgi:hypothetical protein
MDARLTQALLSSKNDRAIQLGLELNRLNTEINGLTNEIEFFQGEDRRVISEAVLHSASALSALSINTGQLLADLTGKKTLNAIAAVIADIISMVGATASAVATVYGTNFSVPGSGARSKRDIVLSPNVATQLDSESKVMESAASRMLCAGVTGVPITAASFSLPLNPRGVRIKTVERLQFAKTADVERDIQSITTGDAILSTAVLVANPLLASAALAGQVAALVDRHNSDDHWFDARSSNVEGRSVDTITTENFSYPMAIALPMWSGNTGAFVNFNTLATVTAATNKMITGRCEAKLRSYPIVNDIDIEQRSVTPIQFVPGTLLRNAVHFADGVRRVASSSAFKLATATTAASASVVDDVLEITETALQLTDESIRQGLSTYLELISSRTILDTPEKAASLDISTTDSTIVYTFTGHKYRNGNTSGIYTSADLPGYITSDKYVTQPRQLTSGSYLSINSKDSLLRKGISVVESFLTLGSADDILTRSKIFGGAQTTNGSDLYNTTGSWVYEIVWTLTTSTPNYVPGTGYTLNANNQPSLTSGQNIYWTTFNGETFILAYYDGTDWQINPAPSAAS